MAKRKTARPATRARTPGARTRAAGRSTRTAGRTTSAKKRAALKVSTKTAGRKTAGRKTAARKTAARKTLPRRTSGASGRVGGTGSRSPSPVKRPSSPVKTGRPGRSAPARRTTRAPAARASGARTATRLGTAPTVPGTARGGGARRKQVERDRRFLEETVPTPPSSLDLDRRPSAARSGRAEMEEALHEHTNTGPSLTAGDVDADWESAYTTGDEAPGSDMPTPDQAVVEEIGTAIGVQYADNEELKGVDKIEERDRHRWELDPASSEDYQDRARRKK